MPKNFSCNLGSINMYEFVENKFTNKAKFNYEEFGRAIRIAVRGLDTIIDENANNHALKEQKENSLNYRNIGLGAFGFADTLMALGITYGDSKSKEFTDKVFHFMFREALLSSNDLAKELGSFPKYDEKLWDSRIVKAHFTDGEIQALKKNSMRNCSLLSIAPNGSTATMFNLSGGCEPEFAIKYQRKTESLNDGEEKYYDVYCKVAQDYIDANNTTELPHCFITSQQIHWKDRVDIQSIMQKHIDTAISSTVNLPNDTTVEEIEKLYLYAWEQRLKGITIFRDGCKRAGILTTVENKDDTNPLPQYLERGYVIELSDDLIGLKRKLITGCGSLHCLAFFDPITGELMETYFGKGSTGGCLNSLIGLSRMISLSARGGVHIEDIVDQLNSTGSCPSYAVRSATKKDTSKGACCPMAIGNTLKDMYEEMQSKLADNTEEIEMMDDKEVFEDRSEKNNATTSQAKCPECGEPIIHEGGCDICKSCGYSKCS